MNCSIKASLNKRLDVSKTFVLIVGSNTKTKAVRSGSCQYYSSYNSYTSRCAKEHYVDYQSYIEYECKKAVRGGLKIVVLYNATSMNKSKCPDILKNIGTHVAMCFYNDGRYYWDY